MLIAVFVGIAAGTFGALGWLALEFFFSSSWIQLLFGGRWYLAPIAIGILATSLHTALKTPKLTTALGRGPWGRLFSKERRRFPRGPVPAPQEFDSRLPLADMLETYHLGAFPLRSSHWFYRGLISLLSTMFGGIFGLEGSIIEFSLAMMPMFLRERLVLEEKQTFVVSALCASLGVALSAPFTGMILGMELVAIFDPGVRWGAILSSLVAYGVALFWQSLVLSAVFVDVSGQTITLLGSLFSGLRLPNLATAQWLLLFAAAIVLGAGSTLVAHFTSRALVRGSGFFSDVFGKRAQFGALLAGILIALTIWLVPESFNPSSRLWEDLAWMRLSTLGAWIVLLGTWGIFILAFSGWGSSGVFSPMLLIGALLGYALGNTLGAAFAVPMAIMGAVAMLAGAFGVPIAAIALALEVGHGGTLWWVAVFAVSAAAATSRLLKFRPMHELLLEKRGVPIVAGRAANILSRMKTHEAMHRDVRTVQEKASLTELREALITSNHAYLGVLSMEGKYLGLLAAEQLPERVQRALSGNPSDPEVTAVERVFELRTLVVSHYPTLSPEDSLEKAIMLLESNPCLPVLDENRSLLGFVFETSIANRYRREVAVAAVLGL